jgi:hypothetical protein
MKFSQLIPGDSFILKGIEYTKSGPLQAIEKETGAEKMIMRSATIELPRNKADEMKRGPYSIASKVDHVESVMSEYHQTCLSYFDDAGDEQKRMQMEALFETISAALDDLKKQSR